MKDNLCGYRQGRVPPREAPWRPLPANGMVAGVERRVIVVTDSCSGSPVDRGEGVRTPQRGRHRLQTKENATASRVKSGQKSNQEASMECRHRGKLLASVQKPKNNHLAVGTPCSRIAPLAAAKFNDRGGPTLSVRIVETRRSIRRRGARLHVGPDLSAPPHEERADGKRPPRLSPRIVRRPRSGASGYPASRATGPCGGEPVSTRRRSSGRCWSPDDGFGLVSGDDEGPVSMPVSTAMSVPRRSLSRS